MRSIVMVCRRQLIRILGFNIVQELSKIWSKIRSQFTLYCLVSIGNTFLENIWTECITNR